MKRAFFFLLLLSTLSVHAADPQNGKFYRLSNRNSEGYVINEDYSAQRINCVKKGSSTDYTQLWQLVADGNRFALCNAYTGEYIQNQTSQSQAFTAGKEPYAFYFTKNSEGWYTISSSQGGGGFHCDAGHSLVLWWDSNAKGNQWSLDQVSVSEEAVALARAEYEAYKVGRDAAMAEVSDVKAHLSAYNKALQTFFADQACTQLLPTYAAMSDDNLKAAMKDLPASIVNMALKIKNNSWGHREQEFRIRDYKAYSEPDYWGTQLYTMKWCRINNPTGVGATPSDAVYVFVDGDIPSGATLWMEAVKGTSVSGTRYDLRKGLNVFSTDGDCMLFLQYVGNTTKDGAKLISDYPPMRVHIENGTVHGFFEKGVHTDADWRDISQNLSTASTIQVKGDHILFHMDRKYVIADNCCRNTITDAIGWWDDMVVWERWLMGIDEWVPSKCNNLACAISLDGGYQSATDYRTQYAADYIHNLLPYNTMMSNSDNPWGPAHENGHTHQYAIWLVKTAESSNNLFSNLVRRNLGKYRSAGSYNSTTFDDFANDQPYLARDIWSTTRMFWQLFLYFHEAQVDTTFYQRFFQRMREKPLAARTIYTSQKRTGITGNEDVLLFARNACDVSGLDLSEFFQYWGFCTPCNNYTVDDYGTYSLTIKQSEVDEFLAYAHQYPKAPSIIFIEDRVKGVPRTDGGSGFKEGGPDSKAGAVGHFTDFMTPEVKAEGYLYTRTGRKITITKGTGALGFKVVDKHTGALLYGSNALTFNLPERYADADITILAAQADATDAVILSTAEGGTEAEQRAALNRSLTAAKTILDMRDDTGLNPGNFFGSSLESLQSIYDQALLAYTQSDTSVNPYGRWAMMLDDAVSTLRHDSSARVPIYGENIYALIPTESSRYSMGWLSSGIKTSLTAPDDNPEKQWQLIPDASNPSAFTILNVGSGLSITSCELDKRVRTDEGETAVPFLFTPMSESEAFTITLASDPNVYLSVNGQKQVVGSSTAYTWLIRGLVDGHSEALMQKADQLARRAEAMLTDAVDDYLHYPDFSLTDRVCPLDGADVLGLLKKVCELMIQATDIHELSITQSEALLAALESAMNEAAASYVLKQTMPVTDGSTHYYYMQNIGTGLFAFFDDGTSPYKGNSRYQGNIKTSPLDDYLDLHYWFYFVPANENGYYVYNVFSNTPVTINGSYLSLKNEKATEGDIFTLTITDDGMGLVLSTDEGVWTTQSSANGYAQFRTSEKNFTWRLETAAIKMGIDDLHADRPLNAAVYDLSGRRLPDSAACHSQIVIVEGKKILVR